MERRTFMATTGAVALGAGLVGVAPGIVAAATVAPTNLVMFVAAHPDDEILGTGGPFAEHEAAGCDVTHLGMTDGGATGVINILNGTGVASWWKRPHVPAGIGASIDEGYAKLTRPDIERARRSESENALRSLCAGLPGSLSLRYGELPDGYGGTGTKPTALAIAQAQDAILRTANERGTTSVWRLKGHSYRDPSPDHAAIGCAMQRLKALYPKRFADVTYYAGPAMWPKLSTYLAGISYTTDLPTNADIKNRVLDACNCFFAWAPTLGAFALGGQSVPAYWAALRANVHAVFHHA